MNHTVLLVDDDQNVLHGLSRALRRQPYQVYTARSGNEAVEILKAHPIDLVISDEQMPGMSGGVLLAWIAEEYPDVARIVLTGHATTSAAIRAINEGAVYQFLTKPCDEFRLAVTINKALEHHDLLRNNQQLLRQHACQTDVLERLKDDLDRLADVLAGDIRQPAEEILASSHTAAESSGHASQSGIAALSHKVLAGADEARHLIDDMRASPVTANIAAWPMWQNGATKDGSTA